jgi:hypothetical protein
MSAYRLGFIPGRGRIAWVACGLALIGSLSIRSAGIALVVSLVTWLAGSWLTDRPVAIRRLRLFLPLVLAAVLVQATWMRWVAIHEVIEWPIGGYPRSYISQLTVKSGNHPELGPASLADIPPRVVKNLSEHVAGFTTLLTRQDYVNPIWSSPLMLGPLLLVLVGLGTSLWPRGGGVPEWYFVGHEAMYLLWPWDLELRFLLPVAPLAGLFAWRGGRRLLEWATHRPRRAALGGLLVSVPAGAHAAVSAWRFGSRQLAASAVFWALLAMGSLLWMEPGRGRAIIDRLRGPVMAIPSFRTSLSVLSVVCVLAITTEVGIGIARETKLGLDNLGFDVRTRPSYPDIEAARWLHRHTADGAVVMARQVDVVYHYSGRRVIWFPPISEPRTLMDGIHKYGVQFVVVNHRTSSYWLPLEQDCFAALEGAYPGAFRLIQEGARFQIYEVVARQ